MNNFFFWVARVSMINSVNESSLHKILNLVGLVTEYKTCLAPECHQSLSFKFKSKAPLESMWAGVEPESMKYQFSWPTNDLVQQHDAEKVNHKAFQHHKFSGVQTWNQTNKILDQH